MPNFEAVAIGKRGGPPQIVANRPSDVRIPQVLAFATIYPERSEAPSWQGAWLGRDVLGKTLFSGLRTIHRKARCFVRSPRFGSTGTTQSTDLDRPLGTHQEGERIRGLSPQ